MAGQAKERPTWSWKKRTAVVIPMTALAWTIALAVCALLLATPAQAIVFVVDSTVDAVDALPGDGVCADASGACTIRAAVMETNALAGPDVVNLPAGNYVFAIPGTDEDAAATGDLDVTDDLSLFGVGAETTVIDAAGIDRVIDMPISTAADLTLFRVTVTGGVAPPLSIHPELTLPGSGGGIRARSPYMTNFSLSLVMASVTSNEADGDGGGISSSGLLTLIETSVTVNEAGSRGGGIRPFGADSHATLIDSTVSANEAGADGGGIAFGSGKMTIEGSSVSGNSAMSGGGIYACGGSGELYVTNSTISGNSGGGISKSGIDVLVTNSTVTENEGGGIDLVTGYLELSGSVVANQVSGSADCVGAGVILSWGHNLDSDGTCELTHPSELPNTDPMLGPLQDNGGPTFTHALLPGSPAIDAILVADCTYDDDGDFTTIEAPLTTDQRGVARPQGDGCDIGAYEVTACADGIDNDGDGFTDYPEDPGCRDSASTREDPQCQDGINNDPGQDDLIDFDGGFSVLGYVATEPDPQCVGKPWKNNEFRQPSCGLGAELALLLPGLMWLRGWRRYSLSARSRPDTRKVG